MDISSINVQPPTSELMAAHRPIQFVVYADDVVPIGQPMYCDVYFGGVFYKTLTGYSYKNRLPILQSIFVFDIQDTAQEFLTISQPSIMTGVTKVGSATSTSGKQLITCNCKFRGSSYVGGILVPNATIPIQGTDTTAPVSGTGLSSQTFTVFKATLSPLDAPRIIDHMASKRLPISYNAGTSTYSYGFVYPMSNVPYNPTKVSMNNYPSTNMIPGPTDRGEKAIDVYYGDHGFLPVYLPAALAATVRIFVAFYNDELQIQSTVVPASTTFYAVLNSEGVWYIPYAQVDVIAIGGGSSSLSDEFKNTADNRYYRIEVAEAVAGAGHTVYYISPMFRNLKKGYQNTRLWFQNNFGMFEQVSFIRHEETFKTNSNMRFTPLATVGYTASARLDTSTGNKRVNVSSNDEVEVTAVFSEAMMPWVKELLATSIAYQEVEDPESALSSTAQGLMPIVIIDASVATIKIEERYQYLVKVKYTKAIDYINIRN